MTTEIQKAPSFQERIEDKIKESFAELVTPLELKAIVEKGIERALWEPRVRAGRDSYSNPVTLPPLVDEIIEKHATKQIQTTVDQWILEHPGEIKAAVSKAVDGGIVEALQRHLDNRFQNILENALMPLQNMVQEVHNLRQKVGW